MCDHARMHVMGVLCTEDGPEAQAAVTAALE